VWEILKAEGVDPAPHRSTSTWADFLRSQAQARPPGLRIRRNSPKYRLQIRRAHAPDDLDHGTMDPTCRHELLDRTLIWIQMHLLRAPRDHERHYNNTGHIGESPITCSVVPDGPLGFPTEKLSRQVGRSSTGSERSRRRHEK
jgi:hypothetical protein